MDFRFNSLAKLANGSRTVSERFPKRFLQSKGKTKAKGKQNKAKPKLKGKGKSERENPDLASDTPPLSGIPRKGLLKKVSLKPEREGQ